MYATNSKQWLQSIGAAKNANQHTASVDGVVATYTPSRELQTERLVRTLSTLEYLVRSFLSARHGTLEETCPAPSGVEKPVGMARMLIFTLAPPIYLCR
jgi:hypothetical protein